MQTVRAGLCAGRKDVLTCVRLHLPCETFGKEVEAVSVVFLFIFRAQLIVSHMHAL